MNIDVPEELDISVEKPRDRRVTVIKERGRPVEIIPYKSYEVRIYSLPPLKLPINCKKGWFIRFFEDNGIKHFFSRGGVACLWVAGSSIPCSFSNLFSLHTELNNWLNENNWWLPCDVEKNKYKQVLADLELTLVHLNYFKGKRSKRSLTLPEFMYCVWGDIDDNQAARGLGLIPGEQSINKETTERSLAPCAIACVKARAMDKNFRYYDYSFISGKRPDSSGRA